MHVHIITHNLNGVAPATENSVARKATNLLLPPIGGAKSNEFAPATDKS